ncbi:MAG: PQQ-dependent sugar dehydrogenase [Gemmatimonadota bacterium]|jgi:glucose/arabinose dehydrogenase
MLPRISTTTLVAGALLVGAGPAHAQMEGVQHSAYYDFRVVTVAEGLERPWGIGFLPDGDILVTEKAGRLRIIRDGRLLPDPVPGVPPVYDVGQGAFMDVVPHPDFESNHLLYLTYSKPQGGDASTTVLATARFENDRLEDLEEIFVANSEGRGQYGSRVVFDGNGHIFVSVGDRMAPPRGDLSQHAAQDLSNHAGTINRLFEDGSVPPDNPFVGDEGAEPSIWSYGHRNPQGMAIDPETGQLWATEHGPFGGDELNLIEPGKNYGWPIVGFGVNYGSGSEIHPGTLAPDVQPPMHVWVPSIAPSGLVVYDGDQFPEWRGSIFAGGMAGEQVSRLEMDGVNDWRNSWYSEVLVQGIGRVRDVRQGPDGYIYLAIDSRTGDPTPIVRLEPVAR